MGPERHRDGSDLRLFARDGHERALLLRLRSARAFGDQCRAEEAIAALVGCLWSRVRVQVVVALGSEGVQQADLDDVAVESAMRLHKALTNERDVRVPLRVLLYNSVKFEVADFRRNRARRSIREELRDPTDLQELACVDGSRPVEQAAAIEAMLAILSPRDRLILIERELLDRPIRLIAKRWQMTPTSVERACERACVRLRDSAEAETCAKANADKQRQ